MLMLHSFNKLTHTILLISNVSTILVCPNIYIYLLLHVAVNLWESEIGTGFSRNDFGGFKAGLELPILLVLESLQPVHLLFTISLLMF